MKEDFDSTFAQPIIQAIKNNRHCGVPARTHVQPQLYDCLLHKMHGVGLLAWRPDAMSITPLGHHVDVPYMTVFAIRKDSNHERLISWPRQANELAP